MEDKAGWWLIAGGATITIGSFSPWVSASTIFGTFSVSGTDGGGDGMFTLIAGVLLAVLGGVTVSGRSASTVMRVGA